MLVGISTDDPPRGPGGLLSAWEDQLETNREVPKMDLATTAQMLATDHPHLDGTGMERELRMRLRIGMVNAVLDVENLATAIPLEITPPTLRSKIEGETPMTLEEYAHLHHAIARERHQ